jgi:hypothetical protein
MFQYIVHDVLGRIIVDTNNNLEHFKSIYINSKAISRSCEIPFLQLWHKSNVVMNLLMLPITAHCENFNPNMWWSEWNQSCVWRCLTLRILVGGSSLTKWTIHSTAKEQELRVGLRNCQGFHVSNELYVPNHKLAFDYSIDVLCFIVPYVYCAHLVAFHAWFYLDHEASNYGSNGIVMGRKSGSTTTILY